MSTSTFQVKPNGYSSIRQNVIEEARNVQTLAANACASEGRDPPPYVLSELVGKGSFGRVYKAFATKGLKKLVAIKIISIEEGDNFRPGTSDTFGDILHEINTLKLLYESGAKNINIIIDTLLVGQSIWVVTEYCAGGSVATLMRPTKGLSEKWIIPILREVAVALHWIHKQAIIHRDIKCANILINEDGGVQLCDFGVAGIIDTKSDKRSTVTGTLQWMAPEFFDSSVSYGTEVDIWAFGSTAFEMATGLPPNAVPVVEIADFGSYLKQHPPRLEAEKYSTDLKDLIRQCMVEDPGARPPIEQVQRHCYIAGTETDYPTASLQKLVHAYQIWESQGGSRLSLFSEGGARAMLPDSSSLTQDWNFDTKHSSFGESDPSSNTMYDVYGSHLGFPQQSIGVPVSRRRQIPTNTKTLTVPLQKVFNRNTISNYDENVRTFYSKHISLAPPDLPLRADTHNSDVRESLIDLDAALTADDAHGLPDQHTLRPAPSGLPGQDRHPTQEWRFPSTWIEPDTRWDHSQHTIELTSDHTTQQGRPPTREWKFPPAAMPSADASGSIAKGTDELWPVFDGHEDAIPAIETQPWRRTSTMSLIDLDIGESEPGSDGTYDHRPSTAISESASVSSTTSHAVFHYEKHLLNSPTATWNREPSIYVPDDVSRQAVPSVFIPDTEVILSNDQTIGEIASAPKSVPMYLSNLSPARNPRDRATIPDSLCQKSSGPDIPNPPSASVLLGSSSPNQMKEEVRRLTFSLGEHLQFASHALSLLPVREDTLPCQEYD